MGIILDSSVLIAAERRGHTVRQILEQIKNALGEMDIGLSVVTIAELAHGAYRARNQDQKNQRLGFIDRLCIDIPVHPITLAIARRIGRIEGEQAALGVAIAFEDLAIGVTALELGFYIATLNISHSRSEDSASLSSRGQGCLASLAALD